MLPRWSSPAWPRLPLVSAASHGLTKCTGWVRREIHIPFAELSVHDQALQLIEGGYAYRLAYDRCEEHEERMTGWKIWWWRRMRRLEGKRPQTTNVSFIDFGQAADAAIAVLKQCPPDRTVALRIDTLYKRHWLEVWW